MEDNNRHALIEYRLSMAEEHFKSSEFVAMIREFLSGSEEKEKES